MAVTRWFAASAAVAVLAFAGPLVAQPGVWGGPGYGPMGGPMGAAPDGYPPFYAGADPREGRIAASRFVANTPAVAALGHGAIAVQSAPGSVTMGSEDAAFQAAVADQLARAGYRADGGAAGSGQVAELLVRHALVRPPEPRHSPVSGEVAAGGGSYGSGFGLGLSIDLRKPARALIATRLEARIRDGATHELLWEGHAEVVTRDGDRHWSGPLMAQRLAAALFKDFPRPS